MSNQNGSNHPAMLILISIEFPFHTS
uniref:Uncharacterized protein n=1 Tax=Anguilla anguilla TaxID=7936 RepID=A0A0E9VUG9_ANGAN